MLEIQKMVERAIQEWTHIKGSAPDFVLVSLPEYCLWKGARLADVVRGFRTKVAAHPDVPEGTCFAVSKENEIFKRPSDTLEEGEGNAGSDVA